MGKSFKFISLFLILMAWLSVAKAESLDLYKKCGSSRANQLGINRDRLIDYEIQKDLKALDHPDYALFGVKSIDEAKADRHRFQREILSCIEDQVRESGEISISKFSKDLRQMKLQVTKVQGNPRPQIYQCLKEERESARAQCLRQSYGAWLEARLAQELIGFFLMNVSEDNPNVPSDKDHINDLFKLARGSIEGPTSKDPQMQSNSIRLTNGPLASD